MSLTSVRTCTGWIMAGLFCWTLLACRSPWTVEQPLPAVPPAVLLDHTPGGIQRAVWTFCPHRISQACAIIARRWADDSPDPVWMGLGLECRAVQAIVVHMQRRPGPTTDVAGLVRLARQGLPDMPATPQARRALGLVLLLDGQGEAAVEILGEAQNMASRNPYSRMAQVLALLDDPAQAGAALQRYEPQLAILPAFWLTAAWLAEQDRNVLEAERAYRRTLRDDPRNTAAMIGLARLEMDSAETQAVAAERLAQALAVNSEDEVALFNLALIRMRQGHQDQAMGQVRRLLDLYPRDVAAWDLHGLVLRSQGRLHEAETSFRTAINVDPSAASPFFNLGALCAEGFADVPCAIEAFARYLDLEPEGVRAEQVRAWLREAVEQQTVREPGPEATGRHVPKDGQDLSGFEEHGLEFQGKHPATKGPNREDGGQP